MIKNTTIPIDTKNFTLTCEVIGPYDTIYWMKDNMKLNTHTSNNSYASYNIENNMLHFTAVTLDSEGTYQCVATNKAGDHVSPQYRLLVICECLLRSSSEKSAQYSFGLCAKKKLFIILQYIIQTKSFFFQMAQSD